MASRCIGSVAQHLQGENMLFWTHSNFWTLRELLTIILNVALSVYQDLWMYCCCFQLREVLCWLQMSYLLGFMFIFLITKGFVHFGLVCNIHQLELHRDMTLEFNAFLFSNDEAGEKYGDASQQ